MGEVWRTVRISDGLVESCEKFLKTEKARELGLLKIKDVIEYYVRRGIDLDD